MNDSSNVSLWYQNLFGISNDKKPELDLAQHNAVENDKDMIDLQIPDRLQLLGNELLREVDELGYNARIYSRLAPFLVAYVVQQLVKQSPWLDYRTYSMNFLANNNMNTMFSDPGAEILGNHDELDKHDCLQSLIETWCSEMMKQMKTRQQDSKNNATANTRMFRRSLVIVFSTYMFRFEEKERCGHCITLALEAPADLSNVRLLILEYRAHEYIYNVHDKLHQWMANGVGKGQRIKREIVCLKNGGINIDDGFMKCMSVAYRVCIHLAYEEDPSDIHESMDEFQQVAMRIQGELFRMVNWLNRNKDIIDKKYTLTVCQNMANLVFEMHINNHLLLVPRGVFPPNVSINELKKEKRKQSRKDEEATFFSYVDSDSNGAIKQLYYNPHEGEPFSTNQPVPS